MSYNAVYSETYNNCEEWVTLKEASRVTGKSLNAIRMLVHRKKIATDKIKKINDNGRSYWMVHRDALSLIYNSSMSSEVCNSDILQPVTPVICQDTPSDICQDSIPIHYHDQKLKEWQLERDNLLQGVMMYRYKFEELDRQVKMLPAPPEIVARDLQKKEEALQEKEAFLQHQEAKVKEIEEDRQQKAQALAQAQKILHQAQEVKDRYKASIVELKAKLAEEERTREAYRIQWELAQAELARPWWKKMFGMK
jgi:hypothetical protein